MDRHRLRISKATALMSVFRFQALKSPNIFPAKLQSYQTLMNNFKNNLNKFDAFFGSIGNPNSKLTLADLNINQKNFSAKDDTPKTILLFPSIIKLFATI